MFDNAGDYERALASGRFEPETIAALYGLPAGDVEVVRYGIANAIKVVMIRRITAGDPGDRDVYGAQQHAPMLEVEL
jgi:hypothetical protein